ncbi:hypothetical protein FRC07_006806 [Ceratobasidium sp. 392]|nr:hypothetical protein FRC07_006806 [Ceratobasidium sp. 392]
MTTPSMPAPSWTASYSTRRPLTADSPSSPAPSSSASQKFEVKRLLSRPADPIPSPRPLTTFDTSNNTLASEATVKRSNSASRFLRKRPSKGHVESVTPTPSPSQPLPRDSRYVPPAPYSPPPASAASTPTLTPASAYALAYARRTNMTTQPSPSPSRTRHPFESVGTGRVVALGDPADESLTMPVLSLAGFGPAASAPVEKEKEKEKEGGAISLTRKVSARFGKRRRAGTNAAHIAAVQSDAEVEDWSREKERAGMRAVGMSPVNLARPVVSQNRMSRHLSIEDFRGLVQEGGIHFEMETMAKGRASLEKEKERPRESLLAEFTTAQTAA